MTTPVPTPAAPPPTAPAPPIAPPRTLVVRLPNPAGDVVLSTPTLRALRRALPATRIVWAGKPTALVLLDGLPDRDDVAPVEGPAARGLLAPRRCGRAWRALGADAVLLLKDSLGAGLAAWSSRAPVRVGYARHGRAPLLSHPVEPPRDAAGERSPEPLGIRFPPLAALFGPTHDGLPPRLAVPPDGAARAAARFAAAGGARPYFVVSPGAAFGPSKIYPSRLLADAARRVRDATGLLPVVLCGPGEERLAAETAARLGPPVLSTHDDLTRWPEAKAIVAGAALVLTPDAGPRHVAVGFGTPVVSVMGPTDPGWTRGDEALVTVVRREDLSCLGCHLRVCPIGHPCMETLDPAVVASACLTRLSSNPPRAPATTP